MTDVADTLKQERQTHRARCDALVAEGVLIMDPARTRIDAGVRIAAGARIWPDVVLRGDTRIGADSEVRPGCWLEDTIVGEGVLIKPSTVCEGAQIGDGCSVGPMAHLRPGAVLQREAKVGNFVEMKKATLGEGAKASHLTYLGDATVGPRANIGAGTITCNYDGWGKHHTTIGEGAFIGSNSALVAPITIGDGAIVGAGSSLSRDVPDNALAVERAEERHLLGHAPRLHARNRKKAGK